MSLAPASSAAPKADLNIATYIEVIRRRRAIFIQVFVMVVAIGLVITALSKPVYQTYAEILVPMGGPAVSVVDSKDPVNLILATARPEPLKTQVKILQGEPFLEEARKLAKVESSPGEVPPSVHVESLEGMNVIRVTVEGGNPEAITQLANAIVELHLERTDLLTTTGIDKTMEFVQNEQKRVEAALKEAEQKLINFRKSHRVVELTAEQAAHAEEYTQLQAAMQAAKSNLASTRMQLDLLRKRLAQEPMEQVIETRKENPRLPRLQERLDTLRFQREDLLRNYKPNHRSVLDLDAQIAKLEAEMAAEPAELVTTVREANPVRANLQTRIAELEASEETYQTALNVATAEFNAKRALLNNDFGLWEMELTRLTSRRDRLQAEAIELDARLRDLELRANARIRTARILQKASVPTTPIRPKKATNMALAVILGLCLAAAMAFLQEFLDDRVNAPVDLERITSIPALGHVPLIDDANSRLLGALPANSHVAEAYRALRSTIGFAGIDTPLRRLLVTSSSKGEGKSVTSANLAAAMAMDGKRVILVDADLRRPNVHRLFQLPASPGLSEVLVGMRSLQEAIQPTDLENLRVVCAGPIPPNPAELLNSRAFDTLLEELDELADVVIFDSPPCIPVTDPLIVASRVDGVVLVLLVGQTRKAAVKHAQELLQRARARVIGVVFNRVNQRKTGYYYYYNYYYTADGYYAEDEPRRRNGKNGNSPHPKLASGQSVKPRSWQVKSEDDDA